MPERDANHEGEFHAEGLDERGIYGGRSHDPGVPERDANQLAADVRDALEGTWRPVREDGTYAHSPRHENAILALDELVGLVGTLQQALADEKRATASFDAFMADITAVEQANERAVAAEAALATTRQALTQIAETARWYARNGERLAHEVDHALCVEILSMAEDALTDTGGDTKEPA